jgi:hypothetical protein
MRKNPRRILSPQRLPFRHPGAELVSYIVFAHFLSVLALPRSVIAARMAGKSVSSPQFCGA